MAASNLVELDSLEILVIIDNELDPISASPNPAAEQTGGMRTIAAGGPPLSDRAGAVKELRMDHICCSAHGLSLMITGTKDGRQHTVLFDTGPEEHAWERNVRRLRADIGKVELIQLSHWHRDHSGGMLKAIEMINDARSASSAVEVDLHPARPRYRGNQPPEMPIVSLEADPSFSEIEDAGGKVRKNDHPHTVCEDFFLVSGEIPRVTAYEKGLRFGMRCDSLSEGWKEDEQMADERFLMCRLKGSAKPRCLLSLGERLTSSADKGIVMFTGCSHAGVVNASRHAVELASGPPLYAVMGGFHLADAERETVTRSVRDLKSLDPKLLLAGHCTGWRAKFEVEREMPGGRLVPSFVGSSFVL